MTKKEKEKIEEAINEIMNDNGDFAKGISILSKLIGKYYPPGEIKYLKQVNPLKKIFELKKGKK